MLQATSGKRLRKIKEENKLTQQEIAQFVNKSRETTSRLINGAPGANFDQFSQLEREITEFKHVERDLHNKLSKKDDKNVI